MWTSPRSGLPGFLEATGDDLSVHGAPRPGDPLANLPIGQPVGLIAIDLSPADACGSARLEWTAPGATGDDGGTGRRVRFTPTAITSGASLALATHTVVPYARNPLLTG